MATDKISRAYTDRVFFTKSARFLNPGTDTYNVVRLGPRAFVKDVYLQIDTAYDEDSTGSLLVGFIGNKETADPDAFMNNEATNPTATGMKRACVGGADWALGKYFNKCGGLVTVTTDKGDSSTDVDFTLFVEYAIVW